MQGLLAAQGLQARFAAHGLQGFFAAQGLQAFFAAHGLQARFAAQGLQPLCASDCAARALGTSLTATSVNPAAMASGITVVVSNLVFIGFIVLVLRRLFLTPAPGAVFFCKVP